MTRKPRGLTRQMEQLIESALAPGRFIPYNANYDFVGDLEAAEKQIASLVPTEPELMDDDPYGFCYQLEEDAAKMFNKAGLAAFEKQVRTRLDVAATLTPASGESSRRNPDYQRRRCGDMLRTVYLAQKNVDAYVALSEATELTGQDCHALATILVSRRKPAEALSWVERGLLLDKKDPHGSMAGHDLAHLKRDLLTKLGRGNEALDAAWAEYRAHPSKYSYDALSNFERARRCYEKAGLVADWQSVVSKVRSEHHRKMGFMWPSCSASMCRPSTST